MKKIQFAVLAGALPVLGCVAAIPEGNYSRGPAVKGSQTVSMALGECRLLATKMTKPALFPIRSAEIIDACMTEKGYLRTGSSSVEP